MTSTLGAALPPTLTPATAGLAGSPAGLGEKARAVAAAVGEADDPEVAVRAADRVVVLSGAVVAIAITTTAAQHTGCRNRAHANWPSP